MSKNAIAISLLLVILPQLGVKLDLSQVSNLVGAVGTVISISLLVVNQLNRPNIKAFFWKTK